MENQINTQEGPSFIQPITQGTSSQNGSIKDSNEVTNTALDKKPFRRALFLISFAALLFFFGICILYVGEIVFIGPLLMSFAPSICFLGVVLFFIGVSIMCSSKKITIVCLSATLSILLGINTRLPSVFSDVLNRHSNKISISLPLQGEVGQPIHVISKLVEISGRQYQYASIAPSCGEQCFILNGFRTPSSLVESNYWHENIVNTVLASGFTIAKEDESAPTISVVENNLSNTDNLKITLADKDGKLLADYNGSYRRGFKFETEDNKYYKGFSLAPMFEYVLHSNPAVSLASMFAVNTNSYPLASFLKKATKLSSVQGSNLGFEKSSNESTSEMVNLEILEEKNYDPTLSMDGDEWSKLVYDDEREDTNCKKILKPEINNASLMGTWYLFVNDPTNRKKVRYTGAAICDTGAVWFMDYVVEKGRMVLTKYSTLGDFLYRISFEKPKELYGYAGSIAVPSFKDEGGYLYFDWWNSNQSGSNRYIKRSMKVRLPESTIKIPLTSTTTNSFPVASNNSTTTN